MVSKIGQLLKMPQVFWYEAKPLEEFNWNKYLRELYEIE